MFTADNEQIITGTLDLPVQLACKNASLNEQRADKNIGNYGIDADAQQAYKKGRARPDVK